MIRLFIFYNNLDYLSNLTCNLSNIQNLKLLGISSSVTKDSISICNNVKPNIIISNNSNFQILNNHLNFEYIPLYIREQSIYDIKILIHQLKKLSQNTKYSYKLEITNLKKEVYKKLIDLNFNPNMLGMTYLIDCIVCLHEIPYSQLSHFELENCYKKIGHKYSVTPTSVKWNIKKSIENIYDFSTQISNLKNMKDEISINCFSIINSFQFLY